MGYSYTTQDSGGYSNGYHQMKVFVYADNPKDESKCQNFVIPALIDAFEQAYSSINQIDYWEVAYADSHPDMWLTGSDWWLNKEDALEEFRNHLDLRSGIPTGSHLLIETEGKGGLADGGDLCQKETETEYERDAWFDWSPAVLGTKDDSNGMVRNLAIHEALHNFIDNCLSGVQALIDDNEHELGQVYSNTWSDTVSPMMTTYVDELQGNGDCQSGAWWDNDYSQTLTSCTKDALDETATEHGY